MNEKRNFDYKKLHPFKWYILENFPFLEDSIDALTNYQLFCKLGEMYNKQVDSINTLGIQVEGITDWFDDLDVQEEINNKLDKMAESGDLEEIISAYLNTKAVLCFDNVTDMKNSVNLINGSYARTLGYYEKNDGGSALYKIRQITNDDVIDEMFIIEMNDLQNQLIAELIIEQPLKVEQIGAKGDGISDDTLFIQSALNKVNNIIMNKDYKVSEITINKSDLKLKFNIINGTIKIDASQLIQFVDIEGNRLINENGVGLSLISHNNYGIQYCKFSIGLIRANDCIKFNSSDGGWINNNYFYKTNVSLGTGITSVALTGNSKYDGNMFVEFGFEDITKWFNMNTFSETLFEKCRMIPFEADGQGNTIRELGTLNNCKNIVFNNKTNGTFYEFITLTSSNAIITGKAMRWEGVKDGKYMCLNSNGNIDYIEFDTPIFKQNMSSLTGTTIIETYNYNVSKPIIFNYDESKYTYVNLKIPDKIANALKYVDIVIIGTMGNSMTVTRNNNQLKEIPANTNNTTIRIYL